jgi:hypothetical protein
MQNTIIQKHLILESRSLKKIVQTPLRFTPEYEILTPIKQIIERGVKYNLNPRYKTQIDKFSHNLMTKYLIGLQEHSVIITQPKFGARTQETLDANNLHQMYKNYLRFMTQFYKLIIQKKVKGKSKIKKILILIKDFNYLIGYRHT